MGLDLVESVVAFVEKFGITITDEDASELSTPRKVTDYIMSKIGGTGMTREQVVAMVRQIIEEQTATYGFSDDDHFVDGMHLD